MRKKPAILALFVAAIAVMIAAGPVAQRIGPTLHREADEMKREMKTICVGRVLVDVPSEAEVSFSAARISYWSISPSTGTTAEFNEALHTKEAELRAQLNEKGHPSLEAVRPITGAPFAGKIFVYGRKWTDWFENEKKIEATNAATLAHVRAAPLNLTFSSDYGDDAVKDLEKIISQSRVLSPGEIPIQPGFCIDGAMVGDPLTAAQHESLTMFVTLPRHGDFGIALHTAAGRKLGVPLLTRMETGDPETDSRQIVLRSGHRPINGFDGQEFVEKFKEYNGATTHNLYWESIPEPNDVMKPALSFELSTGISARPGGKPLNASLPDEALLTLWDAMVSSIRPRPGAR